MYKDPLTYFWKEFSQHFYMVILHSNILCVRLMIERMNVELMYSCRYRATALEL